MKIDIQSRKRPGLFVKDWAVYIFMDDLIASDEVLRARAESDRRSFIHFTKWHRRAAIAVIFTYRADVSHLTYAEKYISELIRPDTEWKGLTVISLIRNAPDGIHYFDADDQPLSEEVSARLAAALSA